LTGLPVWDVEGSDPETVKDLAGQLRQTVESGTVGEGRLALFIDGVADFTGTGVENDLDKLIRACTREDSSWWARTNRRRGRRPTYWRSPSRPAGAACCCSPATWTATRCWEPDWGGSVEPTSPPAGDSWCSAAVP